MSKTVNKSALAILRDIADYRILALSQLAVLHFGSGRSARRRMQQLVDLGYVESLAVKGSKGPGRPESVFGIGAAGYSILLSEGILPASVSLDQVSGRPLIPQAGHQRLMNWCRIHLTHLPGVLPRVNVRFLSCNSPFALDDGNGYPQIRDCVQQSGENGPIWFSPDAAVAITDTERSMTVPFFLEVDMGTEAMTGTGVGEVEGKILRYQEYFRSNGYKRYEEFLATELRGFRLLFVTNSPQRMDSLCSIVRAMPPSGFMWVTCQAKMFAEGISGKIWIPGGKHESGPQSILGSLSWPAPIPGLDAE